MLRTASLSALYIPALNGGVSAQLGIKLECLLRDVGHAAYLLERLG
jgi:hypothetical protein